MKLISWISIDPLRIPTIWCAQHSSSISTASKLHQSTQYDLRRRFIRSLNYYLQSVNRQDHEWQTYATVCRKLHIIYMKQVQLLYLIKLRMQIPDLTEQFSLLKSSISLYADVPIKFCIYLIRNKLYAQHKKLDKLSEKEI